MLVVARFRQFVSTFGDDDDVTERLRAKEQMSGISAYVQYGLVFAMMRLMPDF